MIIFDSFFSYQERLYLVKACQWVLMEVILKLQNTSQHSVELVNATICLVLYGLNQFTQLQDVNSDRQQQNVFRKLSTHLKAWVSQHLSVLALINLALAKAKEEMKVCFISFQKLLFLFKVLFFVCSYGIHSFNWTVPVNWKRNGNMLLKIS